MEVEVEMEMEIEMEMWSEWWILVGIAGYCWILLDIVNRGGRESLEFQIDE